jgi:hypothetical protein
MTVMMDRTYGMMMIATTSILALIMSLLTIIAPPLSFIDPFIYFYIHQLSHDSHDGPNIWNDDDCDNINPCSYHVIADHHRTPPFIH